MRDKHIGRMVRGELSRHRFRQREFLPPARFPKRFVVPNILLPPPPFVPRDLEQLVNLARLSRKNWYRDCQHLGVLTESLSALSSFVGLHEVKQQICELVMHALQRPDFCAHRLGPVLVIGGPGSGKKSLVHVVSTIIGVITGPPFLDVVQTTSRVHYVCPVRNTPPEVVVQTLQNLITGTEQVADIYIVNVDSKAIGSTVYHDLRSLFMVVLELSKYNSRELREITLQQIHGSNLTLAHGNQLDEVAFDPEYFPNGGNDTACLVDAIVEAHGMTTFGTMNKRAIQESSVPIGMNSYLRNRTG